MLCRPFGDLSRVWLCYVGPLVTLAVFGYVMCPLVTLAVLAMLCRPFGDLTVFDYVVGLLVTFV